MSFQHIRFKGRPYLLLQLPGSKVCEGPILTPRQFSKGLLSFAQLYADGTIKRFGKVIGSKEDIVFGARAKRPPVKRSVMVRVLRRGLK